MSDVFARDIPEPSFSRYMRERRRERERAKREAEARADPRIARELAQLEAEQRSLIGQQEQMINASWGERRTLDYAEADDYRRLEGQLQHVQARIRELLS